MNIEKPESKARTAYDVARAFLDGEFIEFEDGNAIDQCSKNLAKALESYADSVAEERVKEAMKNWTPGTDWTPLINMATERGINIGFRAGQEAMRERAAKLFNPELIVIPKAIRSLPIEEKQ